MIPIETDLEEHSFCEASYGDCKSDDDDEKIAVVALFPDVMGDRLCVFRSAPSAYFFSIELYSRRKLQELGPDDIFHISLQYA